MARMKAPPAEPTPDPGLVPAWLAEGPRGPNLLDALLEFAHRREAWRVEQGLTTQEVHALVRGRAPRFPDGSVSGREVE